MALQRLSPRLAPSADAAIPVFPNGRNPRPLAWLVIAVALLPAFLTLADDRLGFRLVMAALALAIVVIGVGLFVMFGSIERHVVRVDAAAPAVRFAPPAAATVPPVLMALALLLPAIAQAVVEVTGLPTMPSIRLSRGPYALGLLGLIVLGVRLWQLRVPAGLTLTPAGLRGIRGRADIDWRWEDLASVSVVAAPAAKLALVPRGGAGRPVQAPALALGSDPNVVAAIIRHYLENPRERAALLEGGAAAVRRVEDSAERG